MTKLNVTAMMRNVGPTAPITSKRIGMSGCGMSEKLDAILASAGPPYVRISAESTVFWIGIPYSRTGLEQYSWLNSRHTFVRFSCRRYAKSSVDAASPHVALLSKMTPA